jgi:hypothetical protein
MLSRRRSVAITIVPVWFGLFAGLLFLGWAGSCQGQAQFSNSFAARTLWSSSRAGFVTEIGNLSSATAEFGEPAHCGYNASHSAWATWTPDRSGLIEFRTLESATFNVNGVPQPRFTSAFPRISIYTGSQLSALTLVGQNENRDGFESVVRLRVTAGVAYSICVDVQYPALPDQPGSPDADTVIFSLIRDPAQLGNPPGNDNADTAETLPSATIASALGDTIAASVEAADAASYPVATTATGVAKSVWYHWRCPTGAGGVYSVDVDTEEAGDNWEPVLVVYDGATRIEAGQPLSFEPNSPERGIVQATFTAVAGRTYRFMVASDTFYSQEGLFAISIAPASRPLNDNLADAIVLTGAQAASISTLLEATTEATERNHFQAPGLYTPPVTTASIWWKWTAPTTGNFTVDTRGSDGDTILVVYRGTPTTATGPLVSNDDMIPITTANQSNPLAYSLQSVATFNATAGQLFHFCVAGGWLSTTVRLHLASGQPRTPYSAWLLDYPSLTGPSAQATADPDNDGLTNLMELVLGTDPEAPSFSPADQNKLLTLQHSQNARGLDCGYDAMALLGLGVGNPIQVKLQKSTALAPAAWIDIPSNQLSIGFRAMATRMNSPALADEFFRVKASL